MVEGREGLRCLTFFREVSGMTTRPQTSVQETQRRIRSLLHDLPAESLAVVEQFVAFLRQQLEQGRAVSVSEEKVVVEHPPYRYPTLSVPPSSLDAWMNLIPEGYEGDALADTEALYDEV
jgi:hypothetical protein